MKRVRSRRERPCVLLFLPNATDEDLRLLIGLARDWLWDLVDLELSDGVVPEGIVPSGALLHQLPTEPLARQLQKRGCPIVRIGRHPHRHDDRMPVVMVDLRAMGRMAAEHFGERMFRNVAFAGYDPPSKRSDFHETYVEFCEQSKIDGMTSYVYCLGEHRVRGEPKKERKTREAAAMRSWLASLPKPVGIFTYSDAMAARICIVCRETGIEVPEDVAILGIGNGPICDLSPVPLSAIDPGASRCYEQGAILLRRMVDGQEPGKIRTMVSPLQVAERRSTNVLAVEDPLVAKAMRFMRDHHASELGVAQIAAQTGVSSRTLQRAFNRELGRTINTELRRLRLAEACILLRTTDLTITDIAPKVGFLSKDYLHAAFRRAYGMSPREYRKADKLSVS